MGKNVLNAPGLEKLPVPPAVAPENSIPTCEDGRKSVLTTPLQCFPKLAWKGVGLRPRGI
jgi:hypothetical protein